jgi:hypothetical protein
MLVTGAIAFWRLYRLGGAPNFSLEMHQQEVANP